MTCLVANTVFVVRYVGNKWDLNKVLSKKRDKYDEYQKTHCQYKTEMRKAVTTFVWILTSGVLTRATFSFFCRSSRLCSGRRELHKVLHDFHVFWVQLIRV